MLARRAFLEGLLVALLQILYAIVRPISNAITGRPGGKVVETVSGLTVVNHHWAEFEDGPGVRITIQNTGSESKSLVAVTLTIVDTEGNESTANIGGEWEIPSGERVIKEPRCGCETSEVDHYEISIDEILG